MQLDDDTLFDDAADQVVDLGNRLAEMHPEADLWAVADGLIAGAVHYWLYAHQPETTDDDPDEPIFTSATERMAALMELIQESAADSEYLHSPDDSDVGRA